MYMKKLLLSLAIFAFAGSNAQSVSDYKYIFVPTEFKDFPANKYKLKSQLVSLLKAKNYVIIDQADSLPIELQQNPCSLATAEIENNSSMIRNRVLVKLKDCRNMVISEFKGMSMDKEYETGFPDALKKALVGLPNANPKEVDLPTQSVVFTPESKPVRQIQETPQSAVSTPVVSNTNTAIEKPKSASVQIYSNGKINLQKVQIGADQFILVSTESPVPYATFKNTAKQDVYRVTLANGTSTLGYLENNNLVLEIPNGNDFTKEVFVKK